MTPTPLIILPSAYFLAAHVWPASPPCNGKHAPWKTGQPPTLGFFPLSMSLFYYIYKQIWGDSLPLNTSSFLFGLVFFNLIFYLNFLFLFVLMGHQLVSSSLSPWEVSPLSQPLPAAGVDMADVSNWPSWLFLHCACVREPLQLRIF